MPGQKGRGRAREQRGAAAVEFALVVIPLLILLGGVIQVSVWLWAKQAGAFAAREAARASAVSPVCTDYVSFVKNRVGSAAKTWTPDSANPGRGVSRTIIPAPANTSGLTKVGDTVVVKLQYQPVAGASMLPGFPDVTETATARIENMPSTPGAC